MELETLFILSCIGMFMFLIGVIGVTLTGDNPFGFFYDFWGKIAMFGLQFFITSVLFLLLKTVILN